MPADPLVEAFRKSVGSDHLLRPGENVVVGVSGGADSVALLHLMVGYGVRCHVVHVNYRLRGIESDQDAAFVETLCTRLNVTLEIVRVPDGWSQSDPGASLQERARDFRYEAFESAARRAGIQKVAVAHHLEDQAETVLLRLIRGSGLQGAAGMHSRRPISAGSDVELIRPLLRATRSEIVNWLAANDLDYRADSSNLDPKYDRVRLRRQVVPAIIEAFGESSIRNIGRFARRARGALDTAVIGRVRGDLDSALVDGPEPALRIDVLERFEPGWRDLVILEAVRRWMPDAPNRAAVVAEVVDLIDAEPGKRAVFGRSVAWRDRETIVFTDATDVRDDNHSLTPGVPLELAAGTILIEVAGEAGEAQSDLTPSSGDPNVEIADARLLNRPLTVGPWRAGDRFRPLGMTGSKKLSDFLRDERVEPHRKSRILVVRSGDEIVWVVGHRIAEPYRVSDDTQSVVRLTFVPHSSSM